LSYRLFINGVFSDSSNGETYEVFNPASGASVATVARGTVEDAKRAVDAAHDALAKQRRETAPANIARILQMTCDLVRQNESELAKLLTLEQGKTLPESLGEIRFFAHTLEYYAGLKLRGSRVNISDTSKLAVVEKEPVGVVAAIVPWNNPILLMGAKVAAALAAGNAIVVKPASSTPVSTLKSAELFSKAGLPNGLLNFVTGPGQTVGEELITNKKTQKVSFTGETDTGKHIMQLASAQLKRVTLELGGSNPIIIADDADLDAAVMATAGGRFRNAGQGCMCVKRTYVFESVADKFTEKLVARAKMIKVGDGMNPDSTMGPVHSRGQWEKVSEQVSETVGRGAKLLLGGSQPDEEALRKGHFYSPTIVTDADQDSKMLAEEVFGPALPILVVKDMSEAIEKANDSVFGLGAFVWTRDLASAKAAAKELKAGTVLINSVYGAGGWEIEVPMGGFKQSGMGREYGVEGLESYSETKTVIFG
jgi:succinate-semialdehyde dehydrogenase/glutarate-semialdehyde dehydrogenase